jgi:uncharacterized membrane protein YhaH (DUF805 family)
MAAKAPFRFWSFFFSTRGRVSRGPFALFEVSLALAIIALAIGVFLSARQLSEDRGHFLIFTAALGSLYVLTLWPRFAVMAKRCHDVGWSWIVALPMLLPLFFFGINIVLLQWRGSLDRDNMVVFNEVRSLAEAATAVAYHCLILALCFIPGRKGANRFGPDPRNPSLAADVF